MPLPTAVDLGLPPGSVAVVPVPAGGLILYRRVRHSPPTIDDFQSGWTRPQAQLRRIPDLFRTSVSHWLTPRQALESVTEAVPYLACLALDADSLTRVTLTEHRDDMHEPGHVDVWAYPRSLLEKVVDVTRIT